MKLQKGRIGGEERTRAGKMKYFAGTALLIAGLMAAGQDPVKVSKATPEIAPAGSCSRVFTPSAERMLERSVTDAVSAHSAELESRMAGHGKRVVNFALGVDKGGNVQVQDAWTVPESGLSPRDIAVITGLRFEGVKLTAPADGHMCSYSIPISI